MSPLHKRIKKLNTAEAKEDGECVIYFMSRDQRVKDNHALIAAAKHAEVFNLPLVVVFNVYTNVKNRALQQYEWMINGLQKVEEQLRRLGIQFTVTIGKALENYNHIASEYNPAACYFDFSPLRGPRNVKKSFAEKINLPCYVVDTHNIIPVWETSDKEEFAARTIRPKIYKKLQEFLTEPEKIEEIVYRRQETNEKTDWESILKNVKGQKLNDYQLIVRSGEDEAKILLRDFIENHLENYSELRNNPTVNEQSNLSAYLHFGQISSLRIVLEIIEHVRIETGNEISFDPTRNKAANPTEVNPLIASAEAFIEEIVVRKELCDNYCYYNSHYDSVQGLKPWAIKTLELHKSDLREYIYSREELEQAKTHDDAWNAAQTQMIKTGKMHGYMRMYWAKKILEWTPNPETAIQYAIYLNDKYHLDGYDPNGYVGILWSIGGLHDRPWFERSVFGQIRYMNYDGLVRKFKIKDYIENHTNNF